MRPHARPIRAVLFDLDGTLLDSAPDLAAAANRVRAARRLPALALACYRAHAGAGARGMLAAALGITPQDAEFPALRDEFLQYYQQHLTEYTRAFDGVAQLIGQLHAARLPWGIVTNKYARFTEPLLRHMAQCMPALASAQTLVSGDTTAHAKPHPAPLLEAARRMHVAAPDCVYVGDDARDIAAGKAAGMRTVAACYGYLGADARPHEWQADATIATPQQLWPWLARHGF